MTSSLPINLTSSMPITSSLPINLTSSMPITSSLPINLTTTAGLCPANLGQSGRGLPSNQFLSDSTHLPQSYMDQVPSSCILTFSWILTIWISSDGQPGGWLPWTLHGLQLPCYGILGSRGTREGSWARLSGGCTTGACSQVELFKRTICTQPHDVVLPYSVQFLQVAMLVFFKCHALALVDI